MTLFCIALAALCAAAATAAVLLWVAWRQERAAHDDTVERLVTTLVQAGEREQKWAERLASMRPALPLGGDGFGEAHRKVILGSDVEEALAKIEFNEVQDALRAEAEEMSEDGADSATILARILDSAPY